MILKPGKYAVLYLFYQYYLGGLWLILTLVTGGLTFLWYGGVLSTKID